MERFNRFLATHQKPSKFVIGFLWVFWTLFVIYLGVPKVLAFVLMAIGLFSCTISISTAPMKLLKRPLEILQQQCDPYPFLEEAKAQLGYGGSNADLQVRQINYAMALRQIGQYEQAENLLRSINIDQHPGLLPIIKVVYYNNLMDMCALRGKYQEVRIWYEKTVQIFSGIKEGKQKAQLANTVAANRAEYCFAGGAYDEALRIREENRPENLLQQIETAMFCARVYLLQGKREQAAEALRFVEQFGNKVYAVQEARQMLAEMKAQEQ